VRDKRVLRDLITAAAEINERVFDSQEEIDTLLDSIEQRVFGISQNTITQKFVPVGGELAAAYERIEKLHRGESAMGGVPTGFNGIDNLLSGLHKSDLIVLGARPSLGKTALALDIVRNVAVKQKIPVGVFSLEMSKEQIIDRFISAEAGVPLWNLRTGRLKSDMDFELVQGALDKLSTAPIFIDDTPSPTILQMRAMARRLQIERGLGLIVVDYLQLIQPRTNSESLVQQITEISRGLKALARELAVPVLALSQLSRAVDQRDEKRPRLSDLRDSGCLTGEALIMRADTGELLTIQSLADRKIQDSIPVYTLDENWKLVIRPLVKAFSSGRKKVYAMTLRSGRTIRASANHPFRTLTAWRALENLKIGDRLVIPRCTAPLTSPNALSDNELILLAHLLGDGCTLPNQPIHYTSGDYENIETVQMTAKELFGIQGRIVKQKNWWHVYLPSPYRLTRGKPHPITRWFRSMGIDLRHSYEKTIPLRVFQSDQEKTALFLRHLWATDGNISWKKLCGRLPGAAIYYCSTNKTLIMHVQMLLLRLGIQSVTKMVPQGKYRPMHVVQIYGKENQLRFLIDIGSVGARGKIIPELIRALEKVEANTNVDTIPKEAWRYIIEPAKTAAELSWRDVSERLEVAYNGTALQKNGIGRERLERMHFLQGPLINQLAQSDVYWDEVVSIEKQGIEEVYDATVEGTHNFVANDIVVHNSIEQDSDVVMFIYRKDKMHHNLPPEEQNLAEILIEKHRNGPTGKVDLKFDPERASFYTIDKYHG